MEKMSKQLRLYINRYRFPSAQCQACLSQISFDKDFMRSCKRCQSSVHYTHYGFELQQPPFSEIDQLDRWQCERCRKTVELVQKQNFKQIQTMKCQFCPSQKGILKRIIFNETKTIWVHPQCWTWTYPLIYGKHVKKKRNNYIIELPSKPTAIFWTKFEDQLKIKCQICRDSFGYKIKCMYYSCQKYYHCSCARTIGFIRDLESMRLEGDIYTPPYCKQHLEIRVEDCRLKSKRYKEMKDENKSLHFSQMVNNYQTQLKNMIKSHKKYQEDEEYRKKIEYQSRNHQSDIVQISFQNCSESYESHHPDEFYNFILDNTCKKRKLDSQLSQLMQGDAENQSRSKSANFSIDDDQMIDEVEDRMNKKDSRIQIGYNPQNKLQQTFLKKVSNIEFQSSGMIVSEQDNNECIAWPLNQQINGQQNYVQNYD